MKLGHIIKEYREKRSLTQTELANLLSCSRNYIVMVERDKLPVSLDKLNEIGSHLGIRFENDVKVVQIK